MGGESAILVIMMLGIFVLIGASWWILTFFLPLSQRKGVSLVWFLTGAQVNLLLIAFAWLIRPSGILWAILAPWYPPIALAFLSGDSFRGILRFFAQPLMIGVAAAVAVFVVLWFIRSLRVFAIGLAGVTGLAVIAALVPGHSETRIAAAARDANAACLAMAPIWQSRITAGATPQYDLHAVARINGKWHGWSYSTGTFYPLPSAMRTDEIPLIADCKPLQE